MKKRNSEKVQAILTVVLIAVPVIAVMYLTSLRTDYIMEHCNPNFETQKCEFDTNN